MVVVASLAILMAFITANAFAENYRFALVVHVAGTYFWTPVKNGAEDAAKMLGVEAHFMRTADINTSETTEKQISTIIMDN